MSRVIPVIGKLVGMILNNNNTNNNNVLISNITFMQCIYIHC